MLTSQLQSTRYILISNRDRDIGTHDNTLYKFKASISTSRNLCDRPKSSTSLQLTHCGLAIVPATRIWIKFTQECINPPSYFVAGLSESPHHIRSMPGSPRSPWKHPVNDCCQPWPCNRRQDSSSRGSRETGSQRQSRNSFAYRCSCR